MKKVLVSILVLVLACFVIGCASKPAPAPVTTPPWLNDMPPEDVIWGIGIARQASAQMSMTTAEARGRVAVARLLDTKIQAMFIDYTQNAGPEGGQASTSLQQNVSRDVTNVNLSGARPVQRWQAPDGTWWYLVEYKKSDAKNAVASILNNQEAAFAEFKAQQALDMLDKQLAINEKPVRVDN